MKKLKMVINTLDKGGHINKDIYGQFIEQTGNVISNGLFVGKDSSIPNIGGVRTDVIEAFREIKLPLLHWPGGGFAEAYHWRDGIGNKRRSMFDPQAKRIADNSFGTHEFFNLCEELDCDAYLVCNVGSATVEETAEWIEYITSPSGRLASLRKQNGREQPWNLKYLCMGNEWWFYESASAYADDNKKYNFFAKNFGKEPIHRLLRGPQHYDYYKTAALTDLAEPSTYEAMTLYQIISLPESSATEFTEDQYYILLQNADMIDNSITRHLGILKKQDKNQDVRLAVDEWGTWHAQEDADVLWRHQITLRDAIITASVLNIFNKRCNDLLLCTLCMAINALACMILTQDEKMIKTPIFYIFKMYREHQDAQLINSFIQEDRVTFSAGDIPAVSQSVSEKDGKMLITLVNRALCCDYDIDIDILYDSFDVCEGEIITGDIHNHNTFDHPDTISSKPFSDTNFTESGISLTLPKASVISLTLSKEK